MQARPALPLLLPVNVPGGEDAIATVAVELGWENDCGGGEPPKLHLGVILDYWRPGAELGPTGALQRLSSLCVLSSLLFLSLILTICLSHCLSSSS